MLRGSRTFFENDELVQLRRVLDAACGKLGLGRSSDRPLIREHIANLIMQMACRGERDPQSIERNILSLRLK